MFDLLHQPSGHLRLGDELLEQLQHDEWTEFRAAVAFVKSSGVKHIRQALAAFSERGLTRISVGVDLGGTSKEGLELLLGCVGAHGQVWVCHNENRSTFHPKVFLFKGDTHAQLIVGSGNISEGGLFTNYEVSLSVRLNLANAENQSIMLQTEELLDSWVDNVDGISKFLTLDLLSQLESNGYVLPESVTREVAETNSRRQTTTDDGADTEAIEQLFARVAVPRAPSIHREVSEEPGDVQVDVEIEIPEPVTPQEGIYRGFVMTLQRTDVGVGQVTRGTSRRSPEIFIPLAARAYDPEFWGWPYDFTPDQDKPGKMDRWAVNMRLGGSIIDVNMMTWPDKYDFRLRSEELRSAGNVGDIIRIERANGADGFQYYVEIIPSGTSLHEQYLALCVNSVLNSYRVWGYYN